MPTPISWDVYARDRASRTFNTVGSSAHRSGGLVGKFGATLAGAFTGAALYSGVTRLARGMFDLAEAAAEDETAARRMALQYKNSADATNAQVAATEDWISAQGESLGISDDELRPALTRLVTATEDVTAAQELGSLAMEVAAGKQKSLASASEALARGADGNTAALGRLGVRTKNAAGEALTFEQITGRLARTFKGQASESANTAAGAYQRLKVRMSETGEEIGYKLLPHLLDMGDWMLDEGLPAAEDLAHEIGDELGPVLRDVANYVRENKDEWRDMAREVGDNALPILRVTGDVVGTVAGALADLPGPLQSFVIQAGIASRIVPGLNASLMTARDTTGGFVANVRNAESRTRALGGAAKMAGGVGGMMLLADSTQRSSDALGILEGAAGGALMGGAAGPWGALAGGVLGGAMGLLARTTDDAADSMTEAKPPAVDFANSLNQITGAAKGSTRELIRLDLQQTDAFESASKLGISSRDLVRYMMGNEGAIRRVDKAMNTVSETFYTTTDQFGITHRVLVGNQDALIKLQGAIGNTSASLKKSSAEVLFASYTNDKLAKVQRGLAREYELTPKQVSTVVKQVGVISTLEDVRRLIAALEEASKPRTATITYRQMGGPGRGDSGVRIGAGYGANTADRADFAAGFGSISSSVFGAQSDGPMTVDDILSYAAAEQAKAEQAKADLIKLTQMGLSPALIKQLQASGAAGLAQLSTLASGANAQQIAILNATNVATSSAAGGYGEVGATAVYGSAGGYDPTGFGAPFGHGPKGGGGKDRNRELADEIGRAVARELGDVAGELRLSSDGMVATLKRERRRRGPLGLD